MWNNRLQATLRVPISLVAAGGLALLSGCSGTEGPGGPEGPDLTTVAGAQRALKDAYSDRDLEAARLLYSPSFRFVPADPESISFLGPGETEWNYTWEDEIHAHLLVPERTSWIDQVLLETHETQTFPNGPNGVIFEAVTELTLVVGPSDLMDSRSIIQFVYEKDSEGRHILMEQRESPYGLGDMTVGQLKSKVELPPTVEALDPTSVGVNNAVLAARVNANGLPSTYHFEWGTDTSYGSVTPTLGAGEELFEVTRESTVTGLDPATEYHYRAVASSQWGTTRGEDRMFTTLP